MAKRTSFHNKAMSLPQGVEERRHLPRLMVYSEVTLKQRLMGRARQIRKVGNTGLIFPTPIPATICGWVILQERGTGKAIAP